MDESIKLELPDLKINIKIIFVVGHTASGKSQWALEQAQKYQGSIVNIDSVQFYKGLAVGSAAPSPEDLLKAPHYLYSYVHAPDEMTAGNFLRDFYQLIDGKKIQSPIFVVGGTGFYIQALEKGMYDVEPIETTYREQIEEELKSQGAEKLFLELKTADANCQIHKNDHFRLVRAIEVLRAFGKTPSDLKLQSLNQKNKNSLPYAFIKIGFSLPKELALENVQKRTLWMIENGLIQETEKMLNQGFQDWAPLSSVGYKETCEFLLLKKSKAWLVEAINQSTMQLIKKQKTWFKRDSTILWSDCSLESFQKIEQQLDLFLTRIDVEPVAKR
ncbi:MAG: tRNA (adenosine(37)-N6)-dimethylallyltransferase MiaA [Pseudobdellovibrio sp.]